jgi:hypothetical protein
LNVTLPDQTIPTPSRCWARANGGANFSIRSRGGENTSAAEIDAKSRENRPSRLQW